MAIGLRRQSAKGLTYPLLPGAPGADLTALVDALERALEPAWSQAIDTTSGLTYGYRGGMVLTGGAWTLVPDGTVPLVDGATNYVERDADGAVTSTTVGWDPTRTPMAVVVTSGGAIRSVQDARP